MNENLDRLQPNAISAQVMYTKKPTSKCLPCADGRAQHRPFADREASAQLSTGEALSRRSLSTLPPPSRGTYLAFPFLAIDGSNKFDFSFLLSNPLNFFPLPQTGPLGAQRQGLHLSRALGARGQGPLSPPSLYRMQEALDP